MTRRTVKLRFLDADQRLLLVRGRDTKASRCYRYPVDGGIEPTWGHSGTRP